MDEPDVQSNPSKSDISPETHSSQSLTGSKVEKPLRTKEHIICKNSVGLLEGTLFLTYRRLVFVPGQEFEEGEDFQKLIEKSDVISIPLDQIVTVLGNRGILKQSLNVVWHDPPNTPSTTKTDFHQKNRPRNMEEAQNAINEWVSQIEAAALPEGKAELTTLEDSSLKWDQLDTKVLQSLGDMNWKGFFQLERQLEETYGGNLDPDELESCCARLVKEKLIEQDKFGAFFKKLPTHGGSKPAG
jgi:hypothetical protein